MSNHKTKQRLMAMMLSAIMVVGMMPVSALAETGTFPIGTSGEIIAFGALGTDIAVQDIPFGTPQTDLNLPDTLTATIRLTASKEAPILDSGEADLGPDSAETVSGSAVVMDETDGTETGGSEGVEIASPSDAEPAENDGGSPEEVTVPLPVTWTSSAGYDSEIASTYLFTPTLPEGIALASDVEVPTISVRVGVAAILGRVTAFDALPDDIRWQNTKKPVFPEEVSGTVYGETVQIPVSWQTEQDYAEKSPANGLYVFTAVLDEGYTFAGGAIALRITVYIPEAASRFAPLRMGGGGTGASPLEITTAAQLAEIAALVNAGRLESFLFNDNTTTVYLEMINDLDLSAYGMGWKPIGTATNPFKGHFDGNHNAIVGLYINDNTLDNAGLFGSIEGGMVQKLTLSDASVRGATETGGIAGRIKDATVRNCGVTGSVSGSAKVGGVVGVLLGNGKVEHCYSAGSVGGTGNQVGGIAGELTTITSTVQNCYSTAAVKGSVNVGGIAGHVQISENNIQDCAALNPSITAVSAAKGRVAGYYSTESSLFNNVAFSGMTGGGNDKSPSCLDGADITADEIKAEGSIGDRFTATYGWTSKPGKLPGFDAAIAMPAHIIDISGEYFNGEGTSENPYQISTTAQLAKLSELVRSDDETVRNAYNSMHYKLTADIDLSVYNADNIGFNGGKGWIPIGGYFSATLRAFSGVFDGGGYNIKGLYLNDPSYSYGGLFGAISDGTVKNLGVVDVYIRAGYAVGGISAIMIGTLENCFITGEISGKNSVGGMIGDFNSPSSSVINCYSAAAVTGVDEVGGIVGRSNMGCVVNSYVTGTVTGTSKVGGLVGTFYGISGSKVENCFALNPSISGSDEVSRVIGTHMNNGVISGNHAYSGMTVTVGGVVQTITDGTANNINGLAKTADELQGISGFPSGFGSDPWTYTEKMLPGLRSKAVDMPLHLLPTGTSPFGGGEGTSESPYQISTPAQLAKLAELVSSDDETTRNAYSDKHYKLMEDIDLSAYNKSYDGGKGWVPIGRVIVNRIRSFNGKFDGNGKVITGLYINRADEGSIGLFGYIYNANIKNIAVMGANVNGNNKVGGIAGMVSYGTVGGCYVSGTISGERFIGGIVGAHAANKPILQDCRNDASVRGNDDTIGGIVGWTAGVVKNCYATGSVSGSTKVGGIAGDITYAGGGGNVRNCAALNPAITATGADTGRVAGNNTGTLTSNYAFSGMKVNGIIVTNGTAADINGLDMGIAQANAAEFWMTGGNWNISAWNTSIWEITDNKLPVLTVFPAGTQSGDGGLYLIERDIANATVGSSDNFIYNGSQQIPTLTVTFDGAALVKDKDYTLAITSADGTDTSAGTKAGEVTITLTGKGNFKGTKNDVTYTIQPKTVTANMLTLTGGPFTYTGTPHTPDVTVTDGTTLTTGTDYDDISYTDHISAGEARVSVTGKGNYTGTASKNFTIAKAAAPTITWPTATGLAYGSPLSASALAGGSTEYGSFAWSTPDFIPTVTNSGYEVRFTPSADTANNYQAISPATETVQIAVTAKRISGFTVDAIDPLTYTGVAQTPVVAVKDGVTTLISGADYDVTYSDNTSAGTAAVAIEGKGNYTGTMSKNFTIERRPVTVKADDKSMTRGGTLPIFTFTVDGQLSGETALAGVPALTCVADGKTAGSYPITIDLAGVRYTANYEAANPALINGTLTVNRPSSGSGPSTGRDTATIAPEKQPDQPVTAETSVTAMAGQNGTSSTNLSDKAITGAIAKAQDEAKKQGKTANGIGIALNVNLPQGASSLSLSLSQNALQSLVNAGVRSLTINGAIASLSLDLEALKEIQKQGAGSLTITIKPVQILSSGARAMIGTRPVYDVTVSYIKDGKTVNITSLGKGGATLSIPYIPGRNEAVGYLFGVYVDGKGNATRIPDSCYDANSGSIILSSNHFSVYGVGYTAPSAKFTDINSHWGKEAIDYVVGRGLFSGTTDTTFSPNMAMDRGMLITVLGRLSGADVSAYKTSSFTDVAVGKYYLPYIEWAYKKGVVSGIGNGKFAPDQAITREETAVIFENYSRATGYTLPVTHTAAAFGDVSSIGSAYKTAVTAMQQAGIMMGGTNNEFNPKASATRAEVSSMLNRYIKLTIDPATAQGWALNDAGQWLYYKDGKALIGTQTIDGAKYFFNTDGTLKTGWVKDGGDWYYFYADGSLAKNAKVDGYEG